MKPGDQFATIFFWTVVLAVALLLCAKVIDGMITHEGQWVWDGGVVVQLIAVLFLILVLLFALLKCWRALRGGPSEGTS